ncbi:hypothetical protein AAA799P11_00189 [Marine Group I thaumarchaeote SCGC AAA799-P11]|uniref:DUF4214 domain-containing protein n=1 Tax=Marine Group I thaumarchaeote SCGC AAA799-P11 TaxID=1502295 RepID=A0A087S314_9ARCH|nr:hypothetical protein AAA799P11_00189 [Marine Group I thaumarchaeote SCGC AAA799-P11]
MDYENNYDKMKQMGKTGKIKVIVYVVLAILIGSTITYLDISKTDRSDVPDNLYPERKVEKITFINKFDIDKEKIFDSIANVSTYPYVLPNNVISVNILEQSENQIVAEETFIELGIKVTLTVKHTVLPYDQHIIEIIEGDASGTKITLTFEEENNFTKITTDADLDLKGLLSPFGFLPKGNMGSAVNTVLSSFVEYSQRYDNESKIIDDLYREILHRPVDLEGLQYFSALLNEGKITVDEIREELKNSDEFKNQLLPDEIMTLDELSENSKKQVNDLYLEILGRDADIEGLQHFGSLIEIGKMTPEELRNALLNSDEYKWQKGELAINEMKN